MSENSDSEGEASCIGKKMYNNELLHKKCLRVLTNKWSNVSFIFEEENGIVKWPAHKEVLAESSAVFKQMFFGDLKEEGDVKIVDASPSAFKEFLQFFYASQVNLTMENIGEVLKLIDKYDVPNCYPICISFLMDNLTIDDILWVFNLSLTYKFTDLKEHCTSFIQKNLPKVFNMFEKDGGGNVRLTENSPDRFLTQREIEHICPYICEMSKMIVSDWSSKIEFVPKTFSFVFNETKFKKLLNESEIVRFQLNGTLWLTDIFCLNVYRKDEDGKYIFAHKKFDFVIQKSGGKILYLTKIELAGGENHVKLDQPIQMEADLPYNIVMKTQYSTSPYYIHAVNVPEEAVSLAPNVRISFKSRNRSLISRLNFQTIAKK